MSSSTSVDRMANNLEEFDRLREAFNNKTPANNGIVAWLIATFQALSLALHVFGRNILDRLEEAEEDIGNLKATATAPVPSSTTAPTTAATRGSTTTSGRPKRCIKCHARGHDLADCRTSDPAAMRKRVARNSRIAKEARYNRTMPTIPTAPPSPYIFGAQTAHAASIPMDFAALSADATELRRRAAQSARDKRLHRRQSTTT
jgi:hypothetical protein